MSDNYREQVNTIIKNHLFALEYTNLDMTMIEHSLKIKPIKLIEFVNIGNMATDILRLFNKLEDE